MPKPIMAPRMGALLLAMSAFVGSAISIYNYVTPLTGIDGTAGALLVIGSTILLGIAGLALAWPKLGKALRLFFTAAALLDIAGTGFAAYLLNSNALLICMIPALAGWLIYVVTRRVSP